MHQPNYSSLKCSHSDPLEFPYKRPCLSQELFTFYASFSILYSILGEIVVFHEEKIKSCYSSGYILAEEMGS